MGFRQLLIGILAVGSTTGVARAEGAAAVRLEGACLPAGTTLPEVMGVLAADLSPRRVLFASAEPMSATEVVIQLRECTSAPPRAFGLVWRRGESTEIAVDLRDAEPDLRSRTLGMALAEAVRNAEHERAPEAPAAWTAPMPMDAPRERPMALRSETETAFFAKAAFRFVPGTSTPSPGAGIGVVRGTLGGGISSFVADRKTSFGTETVIAPFLDGFADVMKLGPVARLRVNGEFGLAVGSGAPLRRVEGHTAMGVHSALGVGLAAVVPLGAGIGIDGFAGGGYASSLVVQAAGREELGLAGAFIAISLGVRQE